MLAGYVKKPDDSLSTAGTGCDLTIVSRRVASTARLMNYAYRRVLLNTG